MSQIVAVIDRKEGLGNPRMTYDGIAADLPDGTELVPLAALQSANARLAAVLAERDAWREFAEHQGWCADCAESVSSCPSGSAMQNEAIRRAAAGEGDANQGDGE